MLFKMIQSRRKSDRTFGEKILLEMGATNKVLHSKTSAKIPGTKEKLLEAAES